MWERKIIVGREEKERVGQEGEREREREGGRGEEGEKKREIVNESVCVHVCVRDYYMYIAVN